MSDGPTESMMSYTGSVNAPGCEEIRCAYESRTSRTWTHAHSSAATLAASATSTPRESARRAPAAPRAALECPLSSTSTPPSRIFEKAREYSSGERPAWTYGCCSVGGARESMWWSTVLGRSARSVSMFSTSTNSSGRKARSSL